MKVGELGRAFAQRWGRWVAYAAEREGPESLAAFRILLGSALVATVTSVVLAGAVDIVWVDAADGGYRVYDAVPPLVRLLGGATRQVIWTLVISAIVAGVLVTLGGGGRLAVLVAHQSYYALAEVNGHAGGSYKSLLVNGLFLLLLADAGRTWSIDTRLRTGRWASPDSIAAWPRRLALVQLVIVYASAGLQKVGTAWTPIGGFSALYYTSRDLNWARWDLAWLAWVYPLTQVATACTWLFELGWLGVPVIYWLGRSDQAAGSPSGQAKGGLRRGVRRGARAFVTHARPRLWLLAGGVAVHLGISLVVEVTTFGWVMLSFYATMFRPDEYRAVLSRLRRASAGPESTPGAEGSPVG